MSGAEGQRELDGSSREDHIQTVISQTKNSKRKILALTEENRSVSPPDRLSGELFQSGIEFHLAPTKKFNHHGDIHMISFLLHSHQSGFPAGVHQLVAEEHSCRFRSRLAPCDAGNQKHQEY